MDYLRDFSSQTGTEFQTPDSLNSTIGPYRLLYEIGRGFSSIVYQAIDPRRRRTVALKVLTFPQTISEAQREDLMQRFAREARAISALSHPGIVAVYDVGEADDGRRYLAMERLEGETLRARLNREERIPALEAAAIALQIADALHYAHGRGIVHRDIKPDNIFLVSSPTLTEPLVKLMDFGIAHILADQGLTQDGTVVGSPAYMSPEQINGAALDQRTDIFSMGIVLAEMLTGSKPFEAPNIPAVMNQILHQPPHLEAVQSPAIKHVLGKTLAKPIAARYSDASAFADALREAVTSPFAWGRSVSTQFIQTNPVSRPARRRFLPRFTQSATVAVGIVALCLILFALPMLFTRHTQRSRIILQTAQWNDSASVHRQIPIAWQRVSAGTVPETLPRPTRTTQMTARRMASASSPVSLYEYLSPLVPAAPRPPLAPRPPAKPAAPLMVFPRAPSNSPRPIIKVAASREERHFTSALSPVTLAAPIPPEIETITPAMPTLPSSQNEASPPPPREGDLADSPPHPLHRLWPTLPPGMAQAKQTVQLRVLVNEDGDVADVTVLRSSGYSVLDDAAVAAVREWEYDPAIQGGQAVPGHVTEEVKFH